MSRLKLVRVAMGVLMIFFILTAIALDISMIRVTLERWHIVTLLGAALALLGVDRAIENITVTKETNKSSSENENGS